MNHTIKYKQGYIHISYIDNIEVIRYQVDAFAWSMVCKTVQAAKIAINKHLNNYGG